MNEGTGEKIPTSLVNKRPRDTGEIRVEKGVVGSVDVRADMIEEFGRKRRQAVSRRKGRGRRRIGNAKGFEGR